MSDRTHGILYIIGAAFCFAGMNLFIAMSGDLPFLQKAFFRNLFGFFMAALLIIRSGEGFHLTRKNLPWYLLRSASGTVGIMGNFYASSHMNIADSSILNKLSPFFSILFSLWLLKEKPNRYQWLAVCMAFAGALFIMKPTGFEVSLPAAMGTIGGVGAGMAYVCVRVLTKKGEQKLMIILFFSMFSCLACAPSLIFHYQPMTGEQWFYLMLVGCCGAGGQICITQAYSYAPAKEISVFDYTQLFFAGAMGFFFLHQVPDALSFVGYGVILLAAGFLWVKRNA